MDSYTRAFALLFLLAVTHSAAAVKLELGSAYHTRIDDKHLYRIPIMAVIDGYSTFRAVLTSSSKDFLTETSSEIVLTDKGPVLRFVTPQHIDDVVLAARVDYQGRSISKTYELIADDIDQQAAAAGAANGDARSLLFGCEQQWVLKGTLINNIQRILSECDYELGSWPMFDAKNYVDYMILESSKLPGAGGLNNLVDYVALNFGIVGTISTVSRAVGFTDLTIQTNN